MLRVVNAPAGELVSLKDFKAQLRLDHTEEDNLLRTFILPTAIEQVEALTQRRYLTQTLEWVLQCWPAKFALPVAPVASVASVKYVDQNGVQQTLDPATYDVRPIGQGVRIVPKRFAVFPPFLGDAPEPIVVRFIAGGAPDQVPASVKLAVLLTGENLYDNRSAAEPPDIVQSLLISEQWEC